MNNLIEVKEVALNNKTVKSVSARELYLGLGLDKAVWSRWLVTNIVENDFFKENNDWVGFNIMLNGNESKDFAISIDFAKHISMMARTPKGHEYRNYFIELESQQKPLSHLEVLAQSALALVEMDNRTKALESEVKLLSAKIEKSPTDYFTIAGFASMRGVKVDVRDANKLGRKAAKLSKEHDYPIGKAHSEIFGEVNTYHLDILSEVFE